MAELEAERKGKALMSVERLRSIEFHRWNSEYQTCFACGVQDRVECNRHANDCWLEQAIKEASE